MEWLQQSTLHCGTEGSSAAVGRRWPIERCAAATSGGGVQPSASRGKPLARSAGTRQNARNPARLSRKRLGQRQELTRQLATTFAPSAVQRRTSCIGCCTIVYVGALGCTKVRSDQCATVRPLCSAALRRSGIYGAKNRATMCSECELSSNERSKPSSASCAAISNTSPPAAAKLPNAHLPTRAPQHQRTCSIRGPSGESLTR